MLQAATAAKPKKATKISRDAPLAKWSSTAAVIVRDHIGRSTRPIAKSELLLNYLTRSYSKIPRRGRNVRSSCSLYHLNQVKLISKHVVENIYAAAAFMLSTKIQKYFVPIRRNRRT